MLHECFLYIHYPVQQTSHATNQTYGQLYTLSKVSESSLLRLFLFPTAWAESSRPQSIVYNTHHGKHFLVLPFLPHNLDTDGNALHRFGIVYGVLAHVHALFEQLRSASDTGLEACRNLVGIWIDARNWYGADGRINDVVQDSRSRKRRQVCATARGLSAPQSYRQAPELTHGVALGATVRVR